MLDNLVRDTGARGRKRQKWLAERITKFNIFNISLPTTNDVFSIQNKEFWEMISQEFAQKWQCWKLSLGGIFHKRCSFFCRREIFVTQKIYWNNNSTHQIFCILWSLMRTAAFSLLWKFREGFVVSSCTNLCQCLWVLR